MLSSENIVEGKNSIFRILDTASNRTGEGLRVVEDYVRMVLEDRFLSKQLKQLRHDLAQTLEPLNLGAQISSRDSVNDVGRTIQTDSEYSRNSAQAVIKANLTRVQQSLRSIEEFTKTIDPEISKQVEQLRYRSYNVEKAIKVTLQSRAVLRKCYLYVLIDGRIWRQSRDAFDQSIESLIRSGVDLIQLRDKSLSDRDLIAIGKRLAQLTGPTETLWIMNDRADLALITDADGVHLGQDDLSVAQARKILGAQKVVGVSTHNLSQAQKAVGDGANYIGVGPVFPSSTKSFDSHVGLELVEQVAKEIKLPTFAIGGISADTIARVVAVGLKRVAVSAAVTNADEPAKAAATLKGMLIS